MNNWAKILAKFNAIPEPSTDIMKVYTVYPDTWKISLFTYLRFKINFTYCL